MFNTSEFIISATSKKPFKNSEKLNEYVFLGRSNVGKSSLINCLCNKKLLAKVSSKPGKTITLNYYLIDNSFYLVDVPGYGFAQRSQNMKEEFGESIESYLKNNHQIKMCFLLVDTKVGPTNDDLLMYDYLKYLNMNVTVVATKSDKVGNSLIYRHKKQIMEKINDNIILTSTIKKTGINELKLLFSGEKNEE